MSQPTLDSVIAAGPQAGSERSAPFTVLACAIAIIITFGITVENTGPSWSQMAKWGYLPAERIWGGAVWALISSAFVHVAPWHLIFNVYWLWRFGGAVERTLGSFKFLVFVVAAAFLSSALQLAVSGDTGIGASGIVYGLFGLMWRSKEKVPRFSEILGPDTASFFFIWLIACLVATHVGFANIGNTAHFAGLVFGVLVAEWRIRGSHRRMAGAAMVLLCVLSLLTTRSNPWSARWLQHHAMKMHRAGQYQVAALTYERSLSFGADSAWAFHNLALTYFELHDTSRYAAALRNLRVASPAEADSLELRLQGAALSRRGDD
jgi:membrane associated rhomboid family serine protease